MKRISINDQQPFKYVIVSQLINYRADVRSLKRKILKSGQRVDASHDLNHMPLIRDFPLNLVHLQSCFWSLKALYGNKTSTQPVTNLTQMKH